MDGTLDQLVELVGAEDGGMPELAVPAVTPRQLDFPFMTAVEIAAEQMLDVLAHLGKARSEVGRFRRSRSPPAGRRAARLPRGGAPEASRADRKLQVEDGVLEEEDDLIDRFFAILLQPFERPAQPLCDRDRIRIDGAIEVGAQGW